MTDESTPGESAPGGSAAGGSAPDDEPVEGVEAPTDRLGLRVLDIERCWELTADQAVGRLAIIVGSRPHLVPINFVVRGREVLFVSVPGTKLGEVLDRPGAPAQFEVDDFDEAGRAGWSVVVTGTLHPVMDLVEHTRLDIQGRPIWLDGHRDRSWLKLVPTRVEGRAMGGLVDED